MIGGSCCDVVADCRVFCAESVAAVAVAGGY